MDDDRIRHSPHEVLARVRGGRASRRTGALEARVAALEAARCRVCSPDGSAS